MKNGYVLSESFLHLLLWLIFRQSYPNFINIRTAYASKIWAQLTKNLLALGESTLACANPEITQL